MVVAVTCCGDISASYLDLDGTNGGSDESGPMLGVDAMYFFQDDLFYVFGGLYHQDVGDDYQMLGYGMGKLVVTASCQMWLHTYYWFGCLPLSFTTLAIIGSTA